MATMRTDDIRTEQAPTKKLENSKLQGVNDFVFDGQVQEQSKLKSIGQAALSPFKLMGAARNGLKHLVDDPERGNIMPGDTERSFADKVMNKEADFLDKQTRSLSNSQFATMVGGSIVAAVTAGPIVATIGAAAMGIGGSALLTGAAVVGCAIATGVVLSTAFRALNALINDEPMNTPGKGKDKGEDTAEKEPVMYEEVAIGKEGKLQAFVERDLEKATKIASKYTQAEPTAKSFVEKEEARRAMREAAVTQDKSAPGDGGNVRW